LADADFRLGCGLRRNWIARMGVGLKLLEPNFELVGTTTDGRAAVTAFQQL